MTVYKVQRRFIRSGAGAFIASAATGLSVPGGYSFTLSQVPLVQNFTNLFDQYRIMSVNIRIMPSTNVTGLVNVMPAPAITNQAAAYTNIFHYGVDYNDATAPVDANLMIALQGSRSVNVIHGKDINIRLTPRIVAQNRAGYGPGAPGTWLNKDNTTEIHFGVKWFWETNLPVAQRMAVYFTYNLEFRGLS